ncbi:MAG: hypothetical protein A3E87_01470 [Gammaproteobacteria bacterium RIFCSPHIGHO2_12_FULL_35_23]|nr:MAG: hypothetical protein A3E87_01470 [Gammaproteobacteria bacterium RIFCSPHIGHO2_12_FULL_35_23]
MIEAIINQTPGFVFWKSKSLEFEGCNYNLLQASGCDLMKDYIGKTDYEMPWADMAEYYRCDDKEVLLGKTIRRVEPFINHSNQIIPTLVEKRPMLDSKNKIIGMVGYTQLLNSFSNIKDGLGSWLSTQVSSDIMARLFKGISLRESQVLYYYVRGYSMKEISNFLFISPRTVETHLINLKNLFNCKNKGGID